ncbi:MAG: hypothetical protein MJ225_00070 [Bacilli bacterium]|nr:hypothetical protein [Bacilli bacterium]
MKNKFKKMFAFVFAFAMAVGVGALASHESKAKSSVAEEGKTVYCKMEHGWWTVDGAAVGAHYWGGSVDTKWPGERMTPVASDPNVWKITIPEVYEKIIFTRVNPSGDIADWGAKTKDLTIPSDKNLFTITSSSAIWSDPGCDGEWSEYTEPVPDVPAEDGYYLVGTKSNWKYQDAVKLDDGTDGNIAQLLDYAANEGEEFQVRSYLEGVDTWYGVNGTKNNYVVSENMTIDIYINSENKLYVEDADIPASEGYYIQGLFDGAKCWRFENGFKMTNTSADGNVAVYSNLPLKVNDELRVRSYYTDRDPFVAWATLGTEKVDYGEKSGDNFKILIEGKYDVFAKYVSDAFMFYVAPHVDLYEISLTGVKFEGRLNTAVTVDLGSQYASAGNVFNVDMTKLSCTGYFVRGVYEDEACETPYTPKAFEADDSLYVKLTRDGYYVAGDEVFSGSAELAWKVDGAVYLPAATNDTENNILEGSVTIPASASTTPVKVKPLQYTGSEDQPWKGVSYTLGEEYDFCSLDGDSNVVFTKGGTYAVYVNKEFKVYISEGLQAFCTKFLSETGDSCAISDEATRVASLLLKWDDFAATFNSLPSNEKEVIRAIGFDGGDEQGDDAHKVMARYHYILCKYGSGVFANFIFPEADAILGRANNSVTLFNNNTTNTTILVIVICSISVTTLALLAVKKKKQK